MSWILARSRYAALLARVAAFYSGRGMSGKNVTDVVLADAEGIARAAKVLSEGGLVAVPTETVYGLAARAIAMRRWRGFTRPKVAPASTRLSCMFATLIRLRNSWNGAMRLRPQLTVTGQARLQWSCHASGARFSLTR